MMKLKEIERELNKRHIPYGRVNNGQRLIIECCQIGDNAYGYSQSKTKTKYDKFPELKGDNRIIILNCEDCCCCGDW